MQACIVARTGEDRGARKGPGLASAYGSPDDGPRRWTDAADGRYPCRMETGADLTRLWPRWMESAGAMRRMNALVRTRCAKCGTLLRVELDEVVARHGPGHSLVDALERCRMVGCAGSVFYLASRTYGREWTMLLRDPALVASFETLPPARTALG